MSNAGCFRHWAPPARFSFRRTHMSSTPNPESHVDRIQASLDDLVSKRRLARPNDASPAERTAGEIRGPFHNWGLYATFGLLTIGLHAAVVFWLMPDDTANETPHVLDSSGARAPAAPSTEDQSRFLDYSVASTSRVEAPPPAEVGIIRKGDRVVVVPRSTPVERSGVAGPTITTTASTARTVNPPASEAIAQPSPGPSEDDHAQAAREFARRHFRYKFKVGSGNYGVTSLEIVVNDTEEVPSWSRYRSVGEAGLEYYDGSGFRRTTRGFEVLTEVKKGKAVAIDIIVK